MTIVGIAAMSVGAATAKATGFTISNFASQHLQSARLCRDHVLRIEAAHHGEPFGAFFEEIRSYASTCILTSAAALEALANEIFLAPDSPVRIAYGATFEQEFWGSKDDDGIKWKRTPEKYNLALGKLGLPELAKGTRSYENARELIALRNEFMHFKPDWDRRSGNLKKRLLRRFELSVFVPGDGNDFITMRCMSGDCAQWAVEATRGFVREFALRAGPALGEQLHRKLEHFLAS